MKTFAEYQDTVAGTAIYPESGTGSVNALVYLGLGLGEAGEIQGKLKKILRDDKGTLTLERINEILFEAGDLLWYLTRLAEELGRDLSYMAWLNANKLAARAHLGTIQGSGDHR
jgi:hypothetical protein